MPQSMSDLSRPSRPPEAADDADAAAEPDFKPLSAEEAQQWRARQPQWSPWRLLGWQAAAGGVATLLVAVFGGRIAWTLSVGYGVLAVLLPTALMAYRVARPAASPAAMVARMMVWELVKIGLTVGLLLLAPRLVPGLSWPALLAGLVLALKAHWLAVGWAGRRRNAAANRL